MRDDDNGYFPEFNKDNLPLNDAKPLFPQAAIDKLKENNIGFDDEYF